MVRAVEAQSEDSADGTAVHAAFLVTLGARRSLDLALMGGYSHSEQPSCGICQIHVK